MKLLSISLNQGISGVCASSLALSAQWQFRPLLPEYFSKKSENCFRVIFFVTIHTYTKKKDK